MNRCYGNPVPRRNSHDNSTDMNSFPFVRHHFLRSGFEVIDCPPLTAQLKNSSDIRMVMDIRDLLTHDTYFDEFIILSGDADFTPVLHPSRAHARRTVIFANDFTAAPYTAISDGEVREVRSDRADPHRRTAAGRTQIERLRRRCDGWSSKADDARREIIAEVVAGVRASPSPVPLEALADRALRALGHEKTIATGWAGAGSFRELLRQQPAGGNPPDRRAALSGLRSQAAHRDGRSRPAHCASPRAAPAHCRRPRVTPLCRPRRSRPPAHDYRSEGHAPAARRHAASQPRSPAARAADAHGAAQPPGPSPTAAVRQAQVRSERADRPSAIQQSIARIQDACQAPPLAPPEYRVLFEMMAKEINENDLIGAQTLANITQRAQERGLDVRRDDVRFVLEVVSEADPGSSRALRPTCSPAASATSWSRAAAARASTCRPTNST